MTLLVKDANTVAQPLSTVVDGNANLVPLHAPATVSAGGVATPVGPQNPLPIIAIVVAPASDGSGTVATGGAAQALFGGVAPVTGFLVQNNSSNPLWICDVGTASAGGASVQIAAGGGSFATPPGYRPAGAVSLYGGTTGQAFAARRW